jgi:hypothetical protein
MAGKEDEITSEMYNASFRRYMWKIVHPVL